MSSVVIPPLRKLLQRWGVHPDSHKYPACGLEIEDAGLPDLLMVPLAQHVGGAAHPVVAVGDYVLRGQLIGEASGNISAPIHAPTSGEVVAIAETTMAHPSGLPDMAIHIRPDGLDRWITRQTETYPGHLEPEEIAKRVAAAGIVGMGGATFPSAVKLALGAKIEAAKNNWILAFNGKSLSQPLPARWAVKKDGGDFDQFAGATITPRGVVGAVKKGLVYFAAHKPEFLGEATAQGVTP